MCHAFARVRHLHLWQSLIWVWTLGFAVTSLALASEGWTRQKVLSDFYAEGAGVGDLNGDGHADIAYGPFWFEGPAFEKQHRFANGDPFDGGRGYSDNFFSFIHDFNGDGKNDILVFGFPGKSARLYLNSEAERWPMFVLADQVANESPHFVDLIPGGHPEIVCSRDKAYGFYQAGADATQPWTWHAISVQGEAAFPFGHGLGVGDLNGDGRADVIEKAHWYEQPAEGADAGLWKKHRWAVVPQGNGGAQILIDDLDGDGDADFITSLNAHGYGVAWFEQTEPGKFARHDIVGQYSTDTPYGVAFSQPHALGLADMDGDGRKDFVTGKRYFAHQGKDPGGLQAAVLYWFRNTATDDGIEFVPHAMDDDSGVGVEVKIADLNGDGTLDVITSSKKGLILHLQKPASKGAAAAKWNHGEHLPQDQYSSGLSPEEALKRMTAPEGFTVDLIAAEPELTQPIAMCFDARGRIWVIEGHTYPQREDGGWDEGKDRIVIFEDSDADGSFETRKVFAENLNLASGIEVGFGGVYVGAAPYLLFFPDQNGDDKPDGEPEILLDGWAWQDTHETLNAFTWGPDGWLYGCHGVFTHSNVGRPGCKDAERQPINAGVWRFHPVSKQFEVFAHGSSNPWGVDFNAYGDWFISACVIPHFYHLSEGGRYFRQAGQHFDPFTFDDIKTIADHSHYAGDMRILWKERKGGGNGAEADINFTNAVAGGHAHCGLAIYDAPEFPAAYRGLAFFNNLHGHRIVSERLESDGSGYTARHMPDFVFSHNHDYVGVGVMQGPDGALYCSDWVDRQTCHHRDVEVWNRGNGRLFRVRYGEVKTPALKLPDVGDLELVELLGHANSFHARQAQRLLQERAVAKVLDTMAVEKALASFEQKHADDVPLRLRALWTRHVTGLLTGERVMAALGDAEEQVRKWAVHLAQSNASTLPRFTEMAGKEESLVVRRALASKLQNLPFESRWEIAAGLIAHSRSQFDRNIPFLTWYGLSPLVEADPARALALVQKTDWPQMKDFLTRRAAVFSEGRSAVMTALAQAPSAKSFTEGAALLLQSLASLPPVERPAGWLEAKAKAQAYAKDAQVSDLIARLGARFGDADFFPRWRQAAHDKAAKAEARNEALELLTLGRDPELAPLARELLAVPALRGRCLNALRHAPGAETAQAVIRVLPELPLNLRNEAINLLATRPEMAKALLQAVDAKQLAASLVSPVLLDQFERFDDAEIHALIGKNWSRGGAGVDLAELTSVIESWKKKLTPKVLENASASRGRQVFTMTCGTCHQLFGQGIALGPDLTGSNRGDLGYVLENVLAPSAVVGKDYMLNIFTLKDGATLSGMVKADTPEFIKLSMPGGTTTDVKKSEIASRQELTQSLMPAGLFEALPLEQVADLVKYLASPSQVPLPGESPAPETGATNALPPPASGVVRIEAEALVEIYPARRGGTVKAQNMTRFTDVWSGGSQLWWTGAKPGDIYTFKLDGVKPGTRIVTLFPTTAKDYAQVKIAINGQLREVDFYSEQVLQGAPIRFEGVNISPSETLQIDIHITGKNPAALDRYMVGLDRVEVE